MKKKKCRSCKQEFSPFNSLQVTCSVPCSIAYSRKKRASHRESVAKHERKLNREAKEKLKTRSQWLAEAQTAFNAYIRKRDEGNVCISCGKHHNGQMHAGHYRTTKAAPEIRYHKWNCSLQCAPCNNHLSGNVLEYRIRLIDKIGQGAVDWLEGPHQPQRYTVDDAREIKTHFKQLLREIS